jgi:protoheme IX farnesyltransferase
VRVAEPDSAATSARSDAASPGRASTRPRRPGSADPVGSARPRSRPAGPLTAREKLRAYVLLTKPRIIELLLITTVPAMVAAGRQVPGIWVLAATLVGGALAAGSANALNCVADADIDEVMRRTRNRPLARHTVPTRHALVFGIGLGVISVAFLAATTTWQAGGLTAIAILFYVLVYTLLLKRHTRQNIVWGGLAGCMPVIIGWSAVTGGIGWPAWVFFGVIFFWTPPHTWALAMRYREDYAAAGVPMLPVVAGERAVVRQIVCYSWAMVVCSFALIPASSWLYAAVAVPVGLVFLAAAHVLHLKVVRGERARPMTLFHLSNLYLTIVSVAWAVDAGIGWAVVGWSPWR